MNKQLLYREAFELLRRAQELLDAAGERIRQRLAEAASKAA
jgi:exonuclease VII small subunit